MTKLDLIRIVSKWRFVVPVFLLLSVCWPAKAQYFAMLDFGGPPSIDQPYRTQNMSEFLDKVKELYHVNFIYEPHIVKDIFVSHGVPEVATKSITQLLDEVLSSTDLTYDKISDKDFVIKKKVPQSSSKGAVKPSALLVSGRVVDSEDNSGIPSVHITIVGSKTGTVTDIDGYYRIEVPGKESVLRFAYIGFKTQEIVVGNQTEINVSLEQDIQELGEVVVTAIGIEADKESLSYSVNNVDVNAVVESREANLVSALSGKVAGVQVTSASGAPGASASIRIRGNRSFIGGNTPLFVIDGVPVSNTASGNGTAGVDNSNRAIDINPNDIEKITILKGPSATVLYGSRAANGAVMITTKRGKTGKARITISSSYGISQVNKLPAKQRKYAQGRPSSGVFTYQGPETGENYSWGPLISELEFDGAKDYAYDSHGSLVAAGSGNGEAAIAYNDYDAFFVTGQSYDNNVSISGGTEKVNYYFSLGDMKESGVVPNSDFERISVKSNIQADVTDRLNVGVSASYVNSGGNRVQRGSNVSGITAALFRNTPTFDIGNGLKGNKAANEESTYMFTDHTQRAFSSKYDNPFWVVNQNPYQDNVNRIMGNVNLTYTIFPWLKLNYKLGIDNYTDSRDYAWDVNSSSVSTGEVDQAIRISNRVNSDFLILIDKNLGENFHLNATFGHNFYSQYFESKISEGTTLSIPGFFDISNAASVSSSRSVEKEKYFGAFADVKLGYKDFLFFNASLRNDWSSALPEDKNSLLYPAGGIGFNFTELWPQIQRVISYGKLRASYGVVGNTPSIYQTNTYYSSATADGDALLSSNSFPITTQVGDESVTVNSFERSTRKANENLKPEFTSTLEVGGEFKFLKGRLGVDLTYYYSLTTDALVNATLSATSGYTSIQRNAGTIENQGIELTLSGTPVETKSGFGWDVNVVFTKNASLVKSLPDDVESVSLAEFTAISSLNVVGQPYGVLSGTHYVRDDEGRLVIGSDGWPLISTTQDVLGNPNPDWLMGITNSFFYKGLSFSFLWDIKYGGVMWNGTKAAMDYMGVSKESGDKREVTGYVYDGVVADDDGNATDEINTTAVDFANPAQGLSGIKWRQAGTLLGVAEDNIEDASWVRLRQVTLGYQLSSKLMEKTRVFSNASFSVYARNLLLFTKYKGIDPETNLRGTSSAQGWDYFNMPNTKGYGVSLKLVIK